jgi:hypothetical protein
MSTEQGTIPNIDVHAVEASLEKLDLVEPLLRLDIQADSTTGYAAIQNNIPVVRSLTIRTPGTPL